MSLKAKEIERLKSNQELSPEDARDGYRDLNKLVKVSSNSSPHSRPIPKPSNPVGASWNNPLNVNNGNEIPTRPSSQTPRFSWNDPSGARSKVISKDRTANSLFDNNKEQDRLNESFVTVYCSPKRPRKEGLARQDKQAEIPPRSLFNVRGDPFVSSMPLTTSEIYRDRIRNQDNDTSESAPGTFCLELLKAASDIYDIHKNGVLC